MQASNLIWRWVVPAVMCVLAFAGCSPRGEAPADLAHRPVIAAVDTGAVLRVVLPQDTIKGGGRADVPFYFYVINGPSPLMFDNEPGTFTVSVHAQSGNTIEPVFVMSPVLASYGETTLDLPARAILGQVMNLACISDGAGYGGDPLDGKQCLGYFQFDQPGTYRVVLSYEGDLLRWPRMEEGATGMDTASKVRPERIRGGRRMSDRATLVVLPR